MRGIRRRKGGRTFFIDAGGEQKEVEGGGVLVILGDELRHVRGRQRDTRGRGRAGGIAMRVPLARGEAARPLPRARRLHRGPSMQRA